LNNCTVIFSDLTLRRSRDRLQRLNKKFEEMSPSGSNHLFHIRTFMENLKIINKHGEMVSLIMNRPQETVFEKLMECREKRLPARFICLKSRQLGISTLIEAFIFALVTRYPNRFALVAAHSMESAQMVFSMARRFHRHLPSRGRMNLARNSTRRIEYAPPHYSHIQIDTAANRNLGRGGTIHYVHAGEVAFWDKPEEPILAINQAVPRHWDTLVFWESTANGVRNMFHRTWVAAQRGDSEMQPIFLTWKGFPEYSLPTVATERLDLTAGERQYVEDNQLTSNQAKWAVHVMKNQCHDSWDKFHQEYPVAAHLAFVFTGMPWFNQAALQEFLDHAAIAEGPKKGRLELVDRNSRSAVFEEHDQGPLKIWKCPEPSMSYSLGMDVGEGVGADYTVIQALCNETGELVATYRSNRVRADLAGVDAYLLGSYYNFGLLGIERNGPGLATLAVCERGLAEFPGLTGYPNLYYHTITDRKIPEETSRLGWITTRTTKEAMLGRLASSVENRSLNIRCRSTLLEMQGFVWDAERKNFRQNYKSPGSSIAHDDEIMALAIANEMRYRNWENRFITARLPRGGEF